MRVLALLLVWAFQHCIEQLESLAKEPKETQLLPLYQQFQNCVQKTKQFIESWLSM